MNIKRLFQILQETVVQIYVHGRGDLVAKGSETIDSTKDDFSFSVPVKSIPPNGNATACVDCHFVKVYINKTKAEQYREEFATIMHTYLKKFGAGDVSFFSVGDDIGSRKVALLILALGHTLGLWEAVTPEADGFDEDAHHRAELGYVMLRREPKLLPVIR